MRTFPCSYLIFIVTGLIAFRIWSVDHAASKFRQNKSTLRPVLAVVVESGAIYSASLTALLAVYLSHSWAQFIILDAVTPIIVGHHFFPAAWNRIPLSICAGNCIQHDHSPYRPEHGMAWRHQLRGVYIPIQPTRRPSLSKKLHNAATGRAHKYQWR